MKQPFRFLILILGITLFSCSQQEQGVTQSEAVALEEEYTDDKPLDLSEESIDIQRKIIKEGNISFETTNVERTRNVILKSVSNFKGYISEDNVYNNSNQSKYRMIIRVPAEAFETFLDDISKNAQKLDSKNIKAIDVTEEFIDIEARIKTKKELENRYKELLKQARTVEDLLNIEKEIGTLRSDIESIEGRLKYLKDRVSFSTLTIVFYEKTNDSFGFTSEFIQAIHDGWTNLLWFFIGLTNVWPLLLVVIIIATIIVKRLRKRNKKKSTA
jgi:hypothetical protein